MQISSLRPTTTGLRCVLIALVGLMNLNAFADTFSVNTQVYGPSFEYGINTDVLNAYDFGTVLNSTNQSFQFQPFSLVQGYEPPPPGLPTASPYVSASGSFNLIDQVTLTEYNNMLQPVYTSSRYVELDFMLADDPIGDRILTLLPLPLVSFGDGINLLIYAPSLVEPEYATGQILGASAIVMQFPTSSAPPPPATVTPEPSSLTLIATGFLALMGVAKRRIAASRR